MKIAFDQHVPAAMVNVFKTLANERGFKMRFPCELVFARDYAPAIDDGDFKAGDDVPWLVRFAKDGGRAVISGDVQMKHKPHELQAMLDLQLVVIFFEGRWGKWKFERKSALLLFHWAAVLEKIRRARRDKLWTLPCVWKMKIRFRNDSPGRKKIHRTNPKASKARRHERAPPPTSDTRQMSLALAPSHPKAKPD